MTRKDFLADAAAAAAAGSPRDVTVRQLIAQWGAKGRGSRVVARIREDLRQAGLAPQPDFRQVALDVNVKLVQRPKEHPPEPQEGEEEILPDFGLTVGTLPSAAAGVEHVVPNASLAEAQTRMIVNDHSQLAVMSGERSLKGAVTWQSIAEALMRSPKASLSDAIVPAHPVSYSDDLLRLVPTIVERNFVFVRDASNRVTGIVTTADLSDLFAERTRPFLLIGEIDQRLRDLLRRHFTMDELRTVCQRSERPRPLRKYDELNMGDYEQVFSSPSHFEKLQWPLDRRTIAARLADVRETRNDVMHFNPDPIDPVRLNGLNGFVELLRKYS